MFLNSWYWNYNLLICLVSISLSVFKGFYLMHCFNTIPSATGNLEIRKNKMSVFCFYFALKKNHARHCDHNAFNRNATKLFGQFIYTLSSAFASGKLHAASVLAVSSLYVTSIKTPSKQALRGKHTNMPQPPALFLSIYFSSWQWLHCVSSVPCSVIKVSCKRLGRELQLCL